MKRLKRSKRGLTFSLDNEKKIGTKFRYFINTKTNEIVIVEDEKGKGTVSRKKCGPKFKPLYDIRSKEVKELVSKAEYMEVEENENKIIVHIYQKIKHSILHSNIVSIEDILCCKTGEIVIDKAVGSNEYLFGKPTLFNDEYFSYLETSVPSWIKKKESNKLKSVYDVVSLFSGAGLLDYSFKDPRVRFVYGLDFSKEACETYKANIGDHIVCDDIRNINACDIPNCDIVIGGPCCQGYSNANRTDINKKSAEDKRLLIEDYVRIVKEKSPKVFVIENVPQLLTKEDGLYISKVIDGLPNYEITCKVISDNRVGGFTIRKRAIVIGSRIGKIDLPDTSFTTVKTVRDALSKVDSTWFNYEDVTKASDGTKMLMSYVPQGGNWENIPDDIAIKYRSSHTPFKKGVTQSNTYKRLSMDFPGVTVPNWRKCILIHPLENRILNVSEAVALMGFDKNFKVYGSNLDSKQQQIGNGVTYAIGTFVKKYVLDALDNFSKTIAFA